MQGSKFRFETNKLTYAFLMVPIRHAAAVFTARLSLAADRIRKKKPPHRTCGGFISR